MSIYICAICNKQKDGDFNCANLDGKGCCLGKTAILLTKTLNKMSYDISTGEIRVRTEFNPSKTGMVDLIKQKTAELINLVESLDENKGGSKSGVGRLKSLSMTSYEEAAMWAVKAATA